MQNAIGTWVVYQKTVLKQGGFTAVCPQREWEEMERARPGYHQLVQAGIRSEADAERMARAVPTAAPSLQKAKWW